jgi:DNA repair protein RadC
MFDNTISRAYYPVTAPHWAVGLGILIGAAKVACVCIAAFLSSLFASLWQAGRGSRKARWCSTSIPTPFRPATPFGIELVGFNLPTGANKMQTALTAREDRAIYRALRILDTKFKNESIQFSSNTSVADYLRLKMAGSKVEEFHVLWLDAQLRLIIDDTISIGTTTQASVFPREVVRRAIESNAVCAIFSHNHPGGDPKPSLSDKLLTQELTKALKLVDIHVLDHIVVTETKTASFSKLGLLQ